MGADGVDAVAADGVFAFNDQIGGIAFEALYQAAIALGVAGEPAAGCDRVAQLILGAGATATARGLGGDEVIRHWVEGSQGHTGDGAERQQIHELPTTHSGHIARGELGHGGRSSSSEWRPLWMLKCLSSFATTGVFLSLPLLLLCLKSPSPCPSRRSVSMR